MSLKEHLDSFDLHNWLDQYVNIKKVDEHEIKVETCPVCLNDKWKLYINVSEKLWICQRCKWGTGINDILVLLSELSGLSRYVIQKEIYNTDIALPKFSDFYNKIAQKYGLVETIEEEPTKDIICPGDPNFTGLVGNTVLNYCLNRGITQEIIKEYKLRKVYKCNGRVGPFLVFPVYFYESIVRWQCRRVMDIEPRYLSAPGIGDWLWPLSNGQDNFDFNQEVILTEGKFDALGAMKYQPIRALCTYGKHITKNQIKVLQGLGIKKIYLCWDLDARKEVCTAANLLRNYFDTNIVDLKSTYKEKTDPGNILTNPTLKTWFLDKLNNSINVKSPTYYKYQLLTKLGE